MIAPLDLAKDWLCSTDPADGHVAADVFARALIAEHAARVEAEARVAALQERMERISNRLTYACDGLTSAEGYVRSSIDLACGRDD